MPYIIFFLVCFGSSAVGAICGIGGGVIIKTVLDTFGIVDVSAISFLSSCTVLSMSAYSVLNNKITGQTKVTGRTELPLAIGAAAGGVIGKAIFTCIKSGRDSDYVSVVQGICLLAVLTGTLIYTLCKSRIRTLQIQNAGACAVIGLCLGVLSSFLGIGGGPINLVVLFYFFSMSTKTAAVNSLHIIFLSQSAGILSTILTGNVPQFKAGILILMVIGGIVGGILGRAVNKKIEAGIIDKLFIGLMVVIIGIDIFNIYIHMV